MNVSPGHVGPFTEIITNTNQCDRHIMQPRKRWLHSGIAKLACMWPGPARRQGPGRFGHVNVDRASGRRWSANLVG